MRHFGLIGRELGHSFSAKFFNGKFRAEGIDADYQLFEIESIIRLGELLGRNPLDGFNVTIPYKESIIPYLDDLSETAREVGAVNCVEVRDGKLIGHNTDVQGIEASLHWLEAEECAKALLLGTGGASKAVQYALKRRGVECTIVSRSEDKGDVTYDMLTGEMIAEHKIIINATPVGMHPNTDEAPMIDYTAIGPEHKVLDLIYNPKETEFLRRSKEQDAQTMNGILMLQTQAIASWHIWK